MHLMGSPVRRNLIAEKDTMEKVMKIASWVFIVMYVLAIFGIAGEETTNISILSLLFCVGGIAYSATVLSILNSKGK